MEWSKHRFRAVKAPCKQFFLQISAIGRAFTALLLPHVLDIKSKAIGFITHAHSHLFVVYIVFNTYLL
jgi:hypothetical protein